MSEPTHGGAGLSLAKILEIIRRSAREADEKARAACLRSKYSIQDYWLCIEFRLQALHDAIAREAGASIRCPRFPFRKAVDAFRRQQGKETSNAETDD